ncbi:uncharacterized protein LOC112455302 [Temnothorax curvispinosus]|uniref:Uncharacterized protein LOC112455302 n=1 Tax=Temnothorax curvispinosus TaxID=300111 RepID=A0A6J1PU95_9HYME|nr:uncharacterized protein LOC112455302 [Temnothorax curvispinosus]
MTEQLGGQPQFQRIIERFLENFKRIGKNNLSPFLNGHAALARTISADVRATLPYFKENQFETTNAVYEAALDYMAECLEELEPVVSPNHSFAASTMRTDGSAFSLSHLPPIRLPPFDGNYDEWEQFRDRFTALIRKNKELDDFTRMHFLSSCLKGRAAECIANIAVTADNFEIAWQTLTMRYENKRRSLNAHLSSILNLSVLSRESASELRALNDKVNVAIASLENLKRRPDDLWNDMLVHIVAQKLDPVTRKAWNLKEGDKDDPPSYVDLRRFLDSRTRALENFSPSPSAKAAPKAATASRIHSATASANSQAKCPLCPAQHFINSCPTFSGKNPSQRRDIVKQHKRCFNCLSAKHSVQACPSKYSCRVCQQKHHSMLHVNPDSSSKLAEADAPDSSSTATPDPKCDVNFLSASHTTRHKPSVLLATAWVTVSAESGRSAVVRALLDQGSEMTFISENLAQTLRARRADEDPTSLCPINIIIGADLYSDIILDGVRKGNPGLPLAQNSVLGWIISGPIDASSRDDRSNPSSVNRALPSISAHHLFNSPTLEAKLRRFWEVEELPQNPTPASKDVLCEKHFRATHYRDPYGQYVRLPFKKGPPISIGESRPRAEQMLKALTRRFRDKPAFEKEYREFLEEYERLGHMRLAAAPSDQTEQHVYIPHHGVIREGSSTTHLRVVFNTSSVTSNGTSLNDHLHVGPKLQREIMAIIMRWRQYRYVYSADIAKMYRQICIDSRDVNYQRIVWIRSCLEPLVSFILLTVTYGMICAPYLALRVLEQLSLDEGQNFPLATLILRDNIYVDDVLFGADDTFRIRQACNQLVSLLRRGDFELRKWASNSPSLLSDLDAADHGLACHKQLAQDE